MPFWQFVGLAKTAPDGIEGRISGTGPKVPGPQANPKGSCVARMSKPGSKDVMFAPRHATRALGSWTDRIAPHRCRNDKGFRVVDFERREAVFRAFNDSGVSFHKVQDVHATLRVMRDGSGKPAAARLNEFTCMKTGPFFGPMVVLGEDLSLIDERSFYPVRIAIPLYVGEAVLKVDGTWLVVESKAAPIPELESEDVRRGADFEHDTISAGAVNGASGNEEVIVPSCGPTVDEFLRVERDIAGVGLRECAR